ncbi:MAG TPA: hypothetical protein VJB15_10730 [Rhodothermia bacterium]|nr:hypothetical protein [Rhodothermia bacterium]
MTSSAETMTSDAELLDQEGDGLSMIEMPLLSRRIGEARSVGPSGAQERTKAQHPMSRPKVRWPINPGK